MPVLGITGGIGTGKTTFTASVAALLRAEVFDADRTARALLDNDAAVQERVYAVFGREIMSSGGGIDRSKLREAAFRDESQRRMLEDILHPLIRASWLGLLEKNRAADKTRWMILDIPLLYETGAEDHMNHVAVVACSLKTQHRRLMEERKLSEAMAAQMINAQLPLSLKIQKADHVVWNDGLIAHLHGQAGLLAQLLSAQ